MFAIFAAQPVGPHESEQAALVFNFSKSIYRLEFYKMLLTRIQQLLGCEVLHLKVSLCV